MRLSHDFIVGIALFVGLVHTIPADGQTLEVIWSTGGTAPHEFVTVGGAVPLGNSVLISDPNASSVYRFDPATGATTVFARKGEGPGEVQTPTLFARWSGNIYLYDLGSRSIEVFAPDGRSLERIRLRRWVTNPKGFAVIPGPRFVISGGMFMDPGAVHLFNEAGEHTSSWVEKKDDEIGFRTWLHTAGGPVTSDGSGAVVFSQSAPHQIFRIDLTNPQSEVVTLVRDDTLLTRMTDATFYETRRVEGRVINSPQWFYDKSSWVGISDDGILINVVTRKDRGDSLWEWWRSGRLLKRIRIQVPYTPLFRYDNGDFLVRFERPVTGEHIVARTRFNSG